MDVKVGSGLCLYAAVCVGKFADMRQNAEFPAFSSQEVRLLIDNSSAATAATKILTKGQNRTFIGALSPGNCF